MARDEFLRTVREFLVVRAEEMVSDGPTTRSRSPERLAERAFERLQQRNGVLGRGAPEGKSADLPEAVRTAAIEELASLIGDGLVAATRRDERW